MPNHLLFLILALLLLAGCAGSSMDTDGPPRLGSDRSLLDNVRASGNLTTLSVMLERAELSETLNGDGPYTLFAPTDAAFAALSDSIRARMLQPGTPQQYNLLAYHLVPVRIEAENFDGRSVRSVNGASLSINTQDAIPLVNRRPILSELPASNGTLYLIDAVLTPPGAQD